MGHSIMTTLNTTANISPLPSGDYIFRVAGLNNIGQGDFSTINTAMPIPDPYFGNVSLLMHMDETNFTDSSNNTKNITVQGSATISNVQSKFGGSSAYFDGSSYITAGTSNDWDLSSGNFTIEGWVYNSGINQYRGVVGVRQNGAGHGWCLYIHSNNTFYTGSSIVGQSYTDRQLNTTIIPENTWTHFALVKNHTGYRLYVNGISGPLLALTNGFNYQSSQPLVIGALGSQGEYPFLGYIDEIRITKGIARYNNNFTPSPVPFPVSPIITISSQPSNQIAISGNATFSVTSTVSLGATLSYQWQKKKGNALFSNIVGATSNSLLLSNLTEADNNGEIYRCEIMSSGAVKLFTNSVVLTVPPVDAAVAEYLVVGGGGGGGSDLGGGGGAGGYKTDNMVLNPNTNYQVVVGLGGSQNISGGNSTLGLITMPGGGGATQYGTNGGSGSGSHSSLAPGVATAPTFGGLGNNGANGVTTGGGGSSSGGGGGAGSAGVAGTVNNGGAGGSGAENSITGTAVYYAAGGGGGVWGGNGGSGGSGIGGSGASSGAGSSASPANRGSGGGGGSSANPGGGSGSAGVVIVAYPDTFGVLSIDNTLTYDEPVRSGYRVYRFTAGSGNITLSST